MNWVFDVHLKNRKDLDRNKYKGALIFGNEDWPVAIRLYEIPDPLVDTPFKHIKIVD